MKRRLKRWLLALAILPGTWSTCLASNVLADRFAGMQLASSCILHDSLWHIPPANALGVAPRPPKAFNIGVGPALVDPPALAQIAKGIVGQSSVTSIAFDRLAQAWKWTQSESTSYDLSFSSIENWIHDLPVTSADFPPTVPWAQHFVHVPDDGIPPSPAEASPLAVVEVNSPTHLVNRTLCEEYQSYDGVDGHHMNLVVDESFACNGDRDSEATCVDPSTALQELNSNWELVQSYLVSSNWNRISDSVLDAVVSIAPWLPPMDVDPNPGFYASIPEQELGMWDEMDAFIEQQRHSYRLSHAYVTSEGAKIVVPQEYNLAEAEAYEVAVEAPNFTAGDHVDDEHHFVAQAAQEDWMTDIEDAAMQSLSSHLEQAGLWLLRTADAIDSIRRPGMASRADLRQ